MLTRALVPLLRPRILTPASRLSIPHQYSRLYAKNTKPKVPYKLPETFKPSKASHSGNSSPESASAPPATDQPSQSDFSPKQVEFDPVARGQEEPSLDNKPQQLPDLTKGIPPTLAAELDAAATRKRGSASLNLTEDPARAGHDGDGGSGDDIPKDGYVSSLDRRRARVMNFIASLFLLAGVSTTVYFGRNWDSEEEAKVHPDAPSGWGLGLFYNRIKTRLTDITRYYKDPAFEKLLPDEDPQNRPPYTLVLSLEDLLVHSEWTREHGWRVAKRPGADYFIRYLSQYYDIVLFTSVPSMMADQVLRKLDPYFIIRWRLFREATKYQDGEYIKDLSYLNRDVSKVVLVDTVDAHARAQPENAIILPKWKGDPKDKSLVALIPFLEYIAGMGVEDVRPVLKSFEGTSIPVEFARREKAMREKFEKQLAEEHGRRPRHGVGGLASLLGLKRTIHIDGEQSPTEGLEQGKMLWDQIRERGQKNYQMMEKEIRENGEKWLAEMAAMEESMRQEQMKSMKGSLTGFFGASHDSGK